MRLDATIAMALAILRVSAMLNPNTKEQIAAADAYMDKCLEKASRTCAQGACKAAETARRSSWWPTENEDVVNKVHLHARGAMGPPRPEIDLHSIDSRCNPANMSEIQRFNGKKWIHHFSCMYPKLCKDVNGIGACQVAQGVYVFKAANDTTILDPIDQAPLLAEKKCNPQNESEALIWNGTDWGFNGVCFPPYICHDFNGTAGFVFCSKPEVISRHIWLPWPTLKSLASRDDDTPDQITRCRDNYILESWNGQEWTHYRDCLNGWECVIDSDPPFNGGCYAESLSQITNHVERRQDVPFWAPLPSDLFEEVLVDSDSEESEDWVNGWNCVVDVETPLNNGTNQFERGQWAYPMNAPTEYDSEDSEDSQ
jgi:hypothetical protein